MLPTKLFSVVAILAAYFIRTSWSSSLVVKAAVDGSSPAGFVTKSLEPYEIEVHFGSLVNDLVILFNVSSPDNEVRLPAVNVSISFCKAGPHNAFIVALQATATKFLRSEELLRLKQDTKCPGAVDPFYEPPDQSPQTIYLTLVSAEAARATIAVIELSNSSAQNGSRQKRVPALENVLFGDFSLGKGQFEIFNYRLLTLDYGLRVVLAMDSQSDATVYLSSCNTAKGEAVLTAVSDEYKAASLSSSSLIDIIESTRCANDQPVIYEDPSKISKVLYVTVGSHKDNTSGAIEVRLEPDDGFTESNSTETPALTWPRLLASQSVNLTRNETQEVVVSVDQITAGLNVSVAVRKGAIALKVASCENGTEQTIDRYNHGYYYLHFDQDELLKLLENANCDFASGSINRSRRDAERRYNLTLALEGLSDVNYARVDVWNGFDAQPQDPNGSASSGTAWWQWLAFGLAFTIFVGLAILAAVYARWRVGHRHEMQRKAALQRMNSDPPPERITAFELASRTWA